MVMTLNSSVGKEAMPPEQRQATYSVFAKVSHTWPRVTSARTWSKRVVGTPRNDVPVSTMARHGLPVPVRLHTSVCPTNTEDAARTQNDSATSGAYTHGSTASPAFFPPRYSRDMVVVMFTSGWVRFTAFTRDRYIDHRRGMPFAAAMESNGSGRLP